MLVVCQKAVSPGKRTRLAPQRCCCGPFQPLIIPSVCGSELAVSDVRSRLSEDVLAVAIPCAIFQASLFPSFEKCLGLLFFYLPILKSMPLRKDSFSSVQ